MAGIKGVYIPQIDAKDLWISNYSKPDAEGYTLLDKNGNINKKRYKAVFDYSLDLMQLRDVYRKAYRNNRFSFIEDSRSGRREYCDRIINVTFEYSVKTWNRQGKDTYIKLGFQGNELEWSDCLGRTKISRIRRTSGHSHMMRKNKSTPHGRTSHASRASTQYGGSSTQTGSYATEPDT